MGENLHSFDKAFATTSERSTIKGSYPSRFASISDCTINEEEPMVDCPNNGEENLHSFDKAFATTSERSTISEISTNSERSNVSWALRSPKKKKDSIHNSRRTRRH